MGFQCWSCHTRNIRSCSRVSAGAPLSMSADQGTQELAAILSSSDNAESLPGMEKEANPMVLSKTELVEISQLFAACTPEETAHMLDDGNGLKLLKRLIATLNEPQFPCEEMAMKEKCLFILATLAQKKENSEVIMDHLLTLDERFETFFNEQVDITSSSSKILLYLLVVFFSLTDFDFKASQLLEMTNGSIDVATAALVSLLREKALDARLLVCGMNCLSQLTLPDTYYASHMDLNSENMGGLENTDQTRLRDLTSMFNSKVNGLLQSVVKRRILDVITETFSPLVHSTLTVSIAQVHDSARRQKADARAVHCLMQSLLEFVHNLLTYSTEKTVEFRNYLSKDSRLTDEVILPYLMLVVESAASKEDAKEDGLRTKSRVLSKVEYQNIKMVLKTLVVVTYSMERYRDMLRESNFPQLMLGVNALCTPDIVSLLAKFCINISFHGDGPADDELPDIDNPKAHNLIWRLKDIVGGYRDDQKLLLQKRLTQDQSVPFLRFTHSYEKLHFLFHSADDIILKRSTEKLMAAAAQFSFPSGDSTPQHGFSAVSTSTAAEAVSKMNLGGRGGISKRKSRRAAGDPYGRKPHRPSQKVVKELSKSFDAAFLFDLPAPGDKPILQFSDTGKAYIFSASGAEPVGAANEEFAAAGGGVGGGGLFKNEPMAPGGFGGMGFGYGASDGGTDGGFERDMRDGLLASVKEDKPPASPPAAKQSPVPKALSSAFEDDADPYRDGAAQSPTTSQTSPGKPKGPRVIQVGGSSSPGKSGRPVVHRVGHVESSSESESESDSDDERKTASALASLSNANVPEAFLCQLSKSLMHTPVQCLCGHHFEKDNLRGYVATYRKCPVSGQPLMMSNVKEDSNLRERIQRYKLGSFFTSK